jgi:hypothetical protein
MSLTVKESRGAESGHWYTRDGLPRYTVIGANGKERATTLRDARKENLVPSVTTILRVANNPVLNNWIQKQVLLAALTLPRNPEENDDSFVARVLEDSKEQGRQAADLGTDIHASIQAFYEGIDDQSYVDHRKGCVRELQAHFGDRVWIAERAFGHELGFGGKCDLHNSQGDGIVVDIKTKDFDDINKVDGYDDHLLQLAAYRVGLGIPNARCANVFVSRTVPGLAVVKEWTQEDLERGWKMFNCLLNFWQLKNNHQ